MKRCYLSGLILILLSCPVISHAQQDFEAAIGLGYNIHSAATNDHVNGNRGGLRAILSGGIFVGESWSLGLHYEQNKWGYSTSTGNIDLALPARSINVYACKHYELHNKTYREEHSEFMIKGNAGYTFVGKGSPYVNPTGSLGYNNRFKGSGINIGLQVEYSHPINKYLSGFIGLGAAKAFLHGTNTRTYNTGTAEFKDKIRYNINYYSATLGIICRF